MPHRTGPTNNELRNLIDSLKKKGYDKKDNFLLRLAKELNKPSRQRREVSLSNINRVSKDKEIIVVPGKVLDGKIEKKITLAAWSFSSSAKKSLELAGCKIISIWDLLKSDKKARIVG